jgi:hypothetical protein
MRVVLGRTFRHALDVRILHLEPARRIERRQVVEVDAVAQRLGQFEVDRIHLQQGKVALAVLRCADLTFHRVAGAQPEAAHLGGGDVDVVRPGEEVRLRRAEESEAVRQDFEGAVAVDRLLVLGERLEDREHDVLLAQRGRVLDLEGFGEGEQVGRSLGLEFGEVHGGRVRGAREGRQAEPRTRRDGGALRGQRTAYRRAARPVSELDTRQPEAERRGSAVPRPAPRAKAPAYLIATPGRLPEGIATLRIATASVNRQMALPDADSRPCGHWLRPVGGTGAEALVARLAA